MGSTRPTPEEPREARLERARRRRETMILRRVSLEAGEEDLTPVFGEDAISLLTQLTRESFGLGGADVPPYTRAQIPCVFLRGRLT
jgi:hypothetical protein